MTTASPPSLTRRQIRRLDELAISELGVPGVVLMENAGRNVAEVALTMLGRQPATAPDSATVAKLHVVVLCGGGNNGGDGLVVARHLHNHGIAVTVYLTKETTRFTGDAATNLNIVRRMGLDLRPVLNEEQLRAEVPAWSLAALTIDALLGTGFRGSVEPHLAAVIKACNKAHQGSAGRPGVPVLAVDLPSGLDCDTGQPSNATVVADRTVTLAAMKVGLIHPAAKPYVGRLEVAGIGTPPSLLLRVLHEPST